MSGWILWWVKSVFSSQSKLICSSQKLMTSLWLKAWSRPPSTPSHHSPKPATQWLLKMAHISPPILSFPLISVHLFCPHKSEESQYFSEICEYSYISRHTHSQRLYMNLQTFGHPSHRFSTCMPTISEYFITCPCTISTPFQIFNAIPIHHTNICRTFGNTWTPIQSILQHS